MNTISTTTGTSINTSTSGTLGCTKVFPITVKVDDIDTAGDIYENLLSLYGGDMTVDGNMTIIKPEKRYDKLFVSSKVRMIPLIEKVIFNPPATIVMWSDGTKTVVKVHDYGSGDVNSQFSKEYGLAMCVAKKFFGSRSQFLKAVENGYFPTEEDGNPDEEV